MIQQGVTSYRPIAPKSAKEDGDRDSTPPGSSSGKNSGKTRRASHACTECQLLRSRCTLDKAEPPCVRCRIHGRVCRFENKDKRHKEAERRTEQLLGFYQTIVEGVMDLLRMESDELTQEVLTRVRQPDGYASLYALVQQHLPPRSPRETDEFDSQGSSDESISNLPDIVTGDVQNTY
ncbi:Zn(II)2Cys6 transcription factor domain-containing protein [Aspergillus saccharolyticus JOP 1030-1]|uniref:Zn(2)-C6 fungal-type domain-containing protein n=1 Tax=Aspergillus saccharolyticus JOP 1030-1 TaxID=1450539 RepID=A0A318ZCC6_9EURO|nr:hypothetical protein BP01DRAFT_383974 [Aspergillus saccharolyticus JOP 1030-1]PYH44177.1 hypothetical protein BP01DRAFT_383974 [Aspergillus saccharolyticus JOP 1030-1]